MIIDIILLGILLIAIVVSAKKGIVRTVLEIAAFVLTIVLAVQIAAPAAKTLYGSFMSERIETKIEESLTTGEAATNAKKAAAVIDSLPGFAKSYLEKTGVNASELAKRIESGQAGTDTAAYLNREFAQPICETVLTGILFLLFSAVIGMLLQVAVKAISKVFKLPIIKTANAALGGLFGAVKGAVLIYIVVALLVFLAPRGGTGKLRQAVDESRVVMFTEQYLPESVFGEGK